MSGRPERGDRFGASLALHTNLAGPINGGLAIGVPGEDVGRVRDAGGVSLAYIEGPLDQLSARVNLVGTRGISQNSARVPGQAESGDRFGAAVVATGHDCVPDEGFDPMIGGFFAIGSPGEDAGGVQDAGIVTLYDYNGDFDGLCASGTTGQERLGSGRSENGDQFGAGLASKLDGDLAIAVPGEDLSSVTDAGRVVYASFPNESTLKFRASETAPIGPQTGLRYATLWGR